jgi:hypothetical protein
MMVCSRVISLRRCLWFTNDGINHKDKAKEAQHGSHLYALYAEDGRIVMRLRRTRTTHQDKADDDNQHTHSQQDEVDFIECEFSFIHYTILFLNIHSRRLSP